MLALILAMLFCVAVGAGVVGYVLVEARREGRGDFWTAEGEELIAGARRTGEKVRTRGERLGRTAAERAGLSAPGTPAADGRVTRTPVRAEESAADEAGDDGRATRTTDGYRAAS